MKSLTPKTKAYLTIFIAGAFGLLAGATANIPSYLNPNHVSLLFSEAVNSQITQAGFFFTVAAWLHSGRVKNEIKNNFSALTSAINHVADAFKEDLKKHRERLDNLSYRIEALELRQSTKE